MNSQSTGRSQKPKGFKVKLVFNIALLLAICFWLLYQMKFSPGKEYSGTVQNKVSEESGSDILGRKGNAGKSGLEEANLVGESIKKDGSGVEVLEDDVFDEAHGNLGSQEGKEKEMQDNEFNNTVDKSSVEVKENDERVGLNEKSMQEETSREGHEDTKAIILDQDGEKDVKNISHDEVGDDKEKVSEVTHDEQENGNKQQKEPQRLEESSTDEDTSVKHGERKNDSLQDPNSVVDGVAHGFDDETGVPLDGNDLIESIVTGSSSNNQSEINESTVNEEVASNEGRNAAEFEAKSDISVEDSKVDVKSKAETSSGNSLHSDTSGIESVSKTAEGGSSVSDS